MKQVYRWMCPHCGTQNTAVHADDPNSYSNTKIQCCDEEIGGCGREVILRSRVQIVWEAYKFDPIPTTTGQSS